MRSPGRYDLCHYFLHCLINDTLLFCVFTQLSSSRKLVVQSSHLFRWLVPLCPVSTLNRLHLCVVIWWLVCAKWEVTSPQPFSWWSLQKSLVIKGTLCSVSRIILRVFSHYWNTFTCFASFWCRAKLFSYIYIIYIYITECSDFFLSTDGHFKIIKLLYILPKTCTFYILQ